MNDNKQKMITYIIVALIISSALIITGCIGVNGLKEIRGKKNSLNVKGTATAKITSDLIEWTGYYYLVATDLKEGYQSLKEDRDKVRDYLISKGLKEEELVFSSINSSEQYYKTPEGVYTDEISGYKFSQTVTIRSSEIEKVTEISRNATEVIYEGVKFESLAPEYIYTKLDELKVTLLAEASKDAANQAKMIVKNAGSKLGGLQTAKISKTQITPLYTNINPDEDDYYYYYSRSNNDTSSIEKEVTIIINCNFDIK